MLWEGGRSSVVGKHSHHVGPFFKTAGPNGDEVPRPQKPVLAPIVVPHSLLKVYGMVSRIRLVYDKDFPSNRCYVTCLSCDEVRLALEHVASLPLAGSDFKTELLHSHNIADNDTDYIPNLFDNHFEFSVPEVRQIPPPRWFVA
ncbi:hypothetical protein E2C01_046900 [Portunus trituberculatus]|uniref:Uncharacterized protein n=1 Tax=Portunus trituberculatus TaxID=210409 RepID=A0A5B7G6B1_PORTR|nr:hypothetical protein [Portunus trituberculatus]